MANKIKIVKHNKRYANGEVSFKMDMNKWGDLTHREFLAKINGANRIKKTK